MADEPSTKAPLLPSTATAAPTELLLQAGDAILGEINGNEPSLKKCKTRPDRSSPTESHTRARSVPDLRRAGEYSIPERPFGPKLDQLEVSEHGFDTKADVTNDGRIDISINLKNRRLSELLLPSLERRLSLVAAEQTQPSLHSYIPPALGGLPGQRPPPRLNVVIHVVGSRGDVQPFIALGRTLKADYGHRVRLATHSVFKGFVEENGLEFFSIGGDPADLMAFMVKNPGLFPGMEALKNGDVGKRRKDIEQILVGCWNSCIEVGHATDDRAFVADAIIANPPSFAHIHVAEKLGIPLHIMFTMPWSPTQAFPHPLANIQSSNADPRMTNFITYALVEMMTWQGLGDIINRFRQKTLGLDTMSVMWAPGVLDRLKVPFSYCWSPALVPKPRDWERHISVAGFFFLPQASSFEPETSLASFLADGPPPVYIGFGSIVVDDPNGLTELIFEAVKAAGVRALVSKGWGGLGCDALDVPKDIYMLGNVPHDWLFQRVSCVLHHGGAGTTAAGIAQGRPSIVVPFFGDQLFWGTMVAEAGAGPQPIPAKQLTAQGLAHAIRKALEPDVLSKARMLGLRIEKEKGNDVGGQSFHDHLDLDNMRCALAPNRVATWRVRRTQIKLSALAACVLASANLISFTDLKLHRSAEYETDDGPWDPISGGASALLGTMGDMTMGIADFPKEVFRAVKQKRTRTMEINSQKGSNASSTRSSSARDSDLPPELQAGHGSPGAAFAPSEGEASQPLSHPSDGTSEVPADSSRLDGERPSPLQGRSSMMNALRGTLSTPTHARSRSSSLRSRSRSVTTPQHDTGSPRSSLETSIVAGRSVARVVGAGIKSPMDFTVGIARGFHNAPRLYGDETVRPYEKVTNIQSGLIAAGKEFGFGFYDGITGLVTQPYRGAEKEGTIGLLKGFGKGLAGVVLKPGAAIWGLPGYTSLGIHRELRRLFGSDMVHNIIAARTTQGYEEFQTSTTEERDAILANWQTYSIEYQHARQQYTDDAQTNDPRRSSPDLEGFLQLQRSRIIQGKKLLGEREGRFRESLSRHTSQTRGCSIKRGHRRGQSDTGQAVADASQ